MSTVTLPLPLLTIVRATPAEYRLALDEAQHRSALVANMTTPARYMPRNARYWLTKDKASGFGINGSELVGVFSLLPHRGDALVSMSISCGASHLDCFDGYLPPFYARHGFIEDHRTHNWTPGQPDVVFMALASRIA